MSGPSDRSKPVTPEQIADELRDVRRTADDVAFALSLEHILSERDAEVRRDEDEECAKIAERSHAPVSGSFEEARANAAAAIRARKETHGKRAVEALQKEK